MEKCQTNQERHFIDIKGQYSNLLNINMQTNGMIYTLKLNK